MVSLWALLLIERRRRREEETVAGEILREARAQLAGPRSYRDLMAQLGQ